LPDRASGMCAPQVIQRLSPQDGETEVALLTFQEYAAVLEGLKRQLALTLDGNSSSSVGQTLETESTRKEARLAEQASAHLNLLCTY